MAFTPFTSGEALTANRLNQALYEVSNPTIGGALSGAKARYTNSGTVSLSTSVPTLPNITLGTEVHDVGGYITVPATSFVVPSGLSGYFMLTASYQGVASSGARFLNFGAFLYLSGAWTLYNHNYEVRWMDSSTTSFTEASGHVQTIVELSAGDAFGVAVWAGTGGGTLELSTLKIELSITRWGAS
jgi:hypothetical protein